jgi:hypothetical protein
MKPRVRFPLTVAKTHTTRPRWSTPARPATAPVDPATARAETERRAQLMTMAELGVYLRYTDSPDPANAAYCWLKRHDVPHVKRGISVLVRVGAVDDYLEAQRKDIAGRALALGRR